MIFVRKTIGSLILIVALLLTNLGHGQKTTLEKDVEVSMRMIGHNILLSSGDSISRVLPIIKEKDRYRIQFEKEFILDPEVLVATVDSVVTLGKIAKGYIVEVEDCKSDEGQF